VPASIQVGVGSSDEIFEGVIRSELRDSGRDRNPVRALRKRGIDARKPLVRLRDGESGQRAYELVAAVPNDRIVRAQPRPQRVCHLTQHVVTASMSARVVDRFEPHDVDERQHEGLRRPPCARDLVLQFDEPRAAAQRAGEIVERGGLAVLRRRRSIRGGRNPVRGRGAPIPSGGHALSGARPVDVCFATRDRFLASLDRQFASGERAVSAGGGFFRRRGRLVDIRRLSEIENVLVIVAPGRALVHGTALSAPGSSGFSHGLIVAQWCGMPSVCGVAYGSFATEGLARRIPSLRRRV
jgi:hypothetical protein